MDVGTQGLASLVVARAFVPRAGWRAWAVIVVSGTIANVDFLSSMLGAERFLEWHRTVAHSILVSVVVSMVLGTAYVLASQRGEIDGSAEKTPAGMPTLPKTPRFAFFSAVILAGLLHL